MVDISPWRDLRHQSIQLVATIALAGCYVALAGYGILTAWRALASVWRRRWLNCPVICGAFVHGLARRRACGVAMSG